MISHSKTKGVLVKTHGAWCAVATCPVCTRKNVFVGEFASEDRTQRVICEHFVSFLGDDFTWDTSKKEST